MAIHRITDFRDPIVGVFCELPQPRQSRFSDRFVVEGRLLVERLLASEFEVESILIDERRIGWLQQLSGEIDSSIPILVVDSTTLDRIVGFQFHRGILACGQRRSGIAGADALLDGGDSLLIVICCDVCDPANLGGILRCAAAFGANGVLVNHGCADPYSRRVLRVSMGSALRIPLATTDDLSSEMKRWRGDHGFEFFATVLDGEPLHEVARPPRLGLVIGNEGFGLPPEVVDLCSQRLTIPMQPGIDSLNAAVASGVFLYHFSLLKV